MRIFRKFFLGDFRRALFWLLFIACIPTIMWHYTAPLLRGMELVQIASMNQSNSATNFSSNYELSFDYPGSNSNSIAVWNVDSWWHFKGGSATVKSNADTLYSNRVSNQTPAYGYMLRDGLRFPVINTKGLRGNVIKLEKLASPADAGAKYWLGWRTLPYVLINIAMLWLLVKSAIWAYRKRDDVADDEKQNQTA